MLPKVTLKPQEHRRIKSGHLWVFSNEIARIEGDPPPGCLVELRDSRQAFLGIGYYNAHSLVAVRLLTREREDIDGNFFSRRIREAFAYRQRVLPGAQSYRLLFGESDGLPGLVVDSYQDRLVLQCFSLGIENLIAPVCDALTEILSPKLIYERNDIPLRHLEGLPQRKGLLRGPPVEPFIISLNGLSLAVSIENGQKTGLFLDQVLNQKAAADYAKDRKVLDCFCYQGGFALACAKAGASHVMAVDESKPALEVADRNSERNGLQDKIEWYQADVFKVLRDQVQRHEKFGLIILDPPSFARSKADLPNARKALKEINSLAMKLLSPGGVLVTCTCSHHVSSEDFLVLLSSASGNTGRSFRILEWRTQSPDHPILLAMPETHYLKCAILEVA